MKKEREHLFYFIQVICLRRNITARPLLILLNSYLLVIGKSCAAVCRCAKRANDMQVSAITEEFFAI